MSLDTPLGRLLRPRSIAIVGLSGDPSKHGARVLDNLRRFGYRGTIWGVNRSLPEVDGVEMFASLDEVPDAPDTIVVAIPPAAVPGVLRTAGDMGVGGAVVFTGGFAEAGEDGASLQAQIRDDARERGLRVLGPNCGGLINPSTGAVMTFLTAMERPAEQLRSGPVALVTQSGGTASLLHSLAAERGSGLALSVSTGNEADVEAAEVVQDLLLDPEVRAIALMLETVRNGPRFVAAARAALAAGKPLVVCKLGRSETGQRTMSTHTGALAGSQRAFEAVVEALGITLVGTPDELFDVAEMLARSPVPTGEGVAFVTHSGGNAVLLADKATDAGISLPFPSPALQERLTPYLQFGAAGNPADLGGIITAPARYAEVVGCFLDEPDYHLVVPVSTPHPVAHTVDRARALAELARASDKPLINLWIAGDLGETGLAVLRETDLPVTADMDSLITAIEGLVRIGRLRREPGAATPSEPDATVVAELDRLRHDHDGRLTEVEAASVVAALGLPVVAHELATSADEAVAAAERIGWPVVLKAVARGLEHKTEAGGVVLNLTGPDELVAACDELTARIGRLDPPVRLGGFLVEEFAPGPEVILGIARDETFGPVVLVGTGGTLAEAIEDVVLGLPPISPQRATRMISSLRAVKLLRGFRGAPVTDEAALADLVAHLSQVALSYQDHVTELDLNPVVFHGGRWKAADALLRLTER